MPASHRRRRRPTFEPLEHRFPFAADGASSPGGFVPPAPPALEQVVDHGSSSNRVDIVFLGDGYTSAQIDSQYPQDIDAMLRHMFNEGEDPYPRYQNYFNAYRVDLVSNEAGADVPPDGVYHDTALDASYYYDGVTDRLLYIDSTKADGYVSAALAGQSFSAEMRIVTVNDSRYGGGGGSYAVFAGSNSASPEIALHELGHSFSQLADEYDYSGGTTYHGGEPSAVNVTTNASGAKWSRWIGYVDPAHPEIGAVGAFEGGMYATHGIYRPTVTSKMEALNEPFNAVSREKIIRDIYNYVDPLDDWLSTATTVAAPDPELWVTPIDPAIIRFEWKVDGQVVADAADATFHPIEYGFGVGMHTVTVRAYDPTDWVRGDRRELEETKTWSVVIQPSPLDFGDAPPSFATLLQDNGARHGALGATLGTRRDDETDGQPDAAARGDDQPGDGVSSFDDEDGLIGSPTLLAGTVTAISVQVAGVHRTNYLSAWIDFNGDGDWSDAGEEAVADLPVTGDGLQSLLIDVPATAVTGQSAMRLRLSTQHGLSFTGLAATGEVEDYLVAVERRVDLALNYSASSNFVVPGSGPANLTYHLQVTNNGPALATNIAIAQSLHFPSDTAINSIQVNSGAFTPSSLVDGMWTIETLPRGTVATLDVVFTVGSQAPIGEALLGANAQITASNETRLRPIDDTASIATSTVLSDVQVELIVDRFSPRNRRLILTGSDAVDHVQIELGVNGEKNRVRVAGLHGTSLDGTYVPLEFTGITQGIFVRLLGGNDLVLVSGRNVAGSISLEGGDGDDRYQIATTKTALVVTDTSGRDALDFSQSPVGVTVNLATNTGRSQGLGSGNSLRLTGSIEAVWGSPWSDKITGDAGDNLLVGGGGNDTLSGGSSGFDVLIGGAGKDTLNGAASGNSLLIGGRTTFDTQEVALLAILDEWRRRVAAQPALLSERISNLTGASTGGLNAPYNLVPAATLTDDLAADTLATKVGGNWVVKTVSDKFKKPQTGDIVTLLGT